MSKAFVREEDSQEDDLEEEGPKIPLGSKNYITPNGFKKLKDEFSALMNEERPALTKTIAWAAGNGDRSENADYIYGKRRLREIDRRIRFLTKRIESAEVIDPATLNLDEVRFGATVTLMDLDDETEKTYTIVGVDEINMSKNHISWTSPLATAILKAQEGDVINFRSPKGLRELEVLKIVYQSLA
ncbi:MAG: transcription elongation factor GreB [Deltaproteobacteria bacterium]|nr:MAG: transcription elongation factor GreB [Deltaproteobacteria bacterium]